MKYKPFFLFTCLLGMLLIIAPFSAFPSGDAPPDPLTVDAISAFLLKNWSYIALLFSEVIAFVPKPYSGILQIILKLAEKLFIKNKKFIKKF